MVKSGSIHDDGSSAGEIGGGLHSVSPASVGITADLQDQMPMTPVLVEA